MRMKDRNKSKKKGFTLVELIVVIVIILVLAAVLVPTVLKYINKAKEAAAIEECAGVVRAAANERTEWLAEGGTEPSETDIVAAAGAGGKITSIDYSADDYDVIKMTYESSNGLTVYFEREHDPQYWIEGKEGNPVLNAINSWVKKADDMAAKLVNKNSLASRESVIKELMKEGKLLAVDESIISKTAFKDMDLYWYPYTVGTPDSHDTILFAGEVKPDKDDGGHGNWSAKIIYVNGKQYVAGDKKNSSIGVANWHKDFKSADEIEAWLKENNYKTID